MSNSKPILIHIMKGGWDWGAASEVMAGGWFDDVNNFFRFTTQNNFPQKNIEFNLYHIFNINKIRFGYLLPQKGGPGRDE